MLKKYLDRFNSEPVGQLLPSNGSKYFNTLVSIGAMFPAKRAMRTTCRACGAEALRHAWEYEDHTLMCIACAGKVDLWPPIQAVRVRGEWLPGELSKQLASTEPEVLLPNRLWRLATIPIRRRSVSVYLMRYVWTDGIDEATAAMEADAAEQQVLLTTKKDVPAEFSEKKRLVIPLVRVAHMEREGLVTSVEQLESAIEFIDPTPQEPKNTSRWFELNEDGSVLRVQGDELSLRRKQRAFVQAIAEAHDAGHLRPKQSSVLRRAGYSRRNTSLSQICRRDEFARFIDWRDGEVSIRFQPLPPVGPQGETEQ